MLKSDVPRGGRKEGERAQPPDPDRTSLGLSCQIITDRVCLKPWSDQCFTKRDFLAIDLLMGYVLASALDFRLCCRANYYY